MSRGYLLELKLLEADGSELLYEVIAGGWKAQFEKEKVGKLTINSKAEIIYFNQMNGWNSEIFQLPFYSDFKNKDKLGNDIETNKSLQWWHLRLIVSIHKIINKDKIEKYIGNYQ
ncbi:MAG: hypothetical protein OXE99_03915 [Cellvibrionales bacterium]|nr:hypothetical protein [Cellvibrionales bacterium]